MKISGLYRYSGSNPEHHGMFFTRIAEFDTKAKKRKWPDPADCWKFDLTGEEIFMVSVENHLQPPHIQKIMAKVDMGGPDDDVKISEGIPGLSWMGTADLFTQEFEKVGQAA